MQPSPNAEQQTTVQILTELLSLVSQNVPTWVDLFAEDAVFESPYAPGTPKRVEGKVAVCNFIKTALTQLQDLRFSNIRAYPTTNPNVLWAEFHGEAVAATTGRPYQQDYVLQLETKEGKVVHYREYSNPLSTIAAFGKG
jgi:uncharacterized protein